MAVPPVDHQCFGLFQKVIGRNGFRKEILPGFRKQHIGNLRLPDQFLGKRINYQLSGTPAADVFQHCPVPALAPVVELKTLPVVQTDIQRHGFSSFQSIQQALLCGGEMDSRFPELRQIHGKISGISGKSFFIGNQPVPGSFQLQGFQNGTYCFVGIGIIFRSEIIDTAGQVQSCRQIFYHSLHIGDAPAVMDGPGKNLGFIGQGGFQGGQEVPPLAGVTDSGIHPAEAQAYGFRQNFQAFPLCPELLAAVDIVGRYGFPFFVGTGKGASGINLVGTADQKFCPEVPAAFRQMDAAVHIDPFRPLRLLLAQARIGNRRGMNHCLRPVFPEPGKNRFPVCDVQFPVGWHQNPEVPAFQIGRSPPSQKSAAAGNQYCHRHPSLFFTIYHIFKIGTRAKNQGRQEPFSPPHIFEESKGVPLLYTQITKFP